MNMGGVEGEQFGGELFIWQNVGLQWEKMGAILGTGMLLS